MPFEDSRRLTGSNLFFPGPGAVLELAGMARDPALFDDWRARVARGRARLGWPLDAACTVRRHARGASLAIAAPLDQLFTATELNEWALCSALHALDPQHWSGLRDALRAAAQEAGPSAASELPAEIDEAAAMARLEQLAAGEARPDLRALVQAAAAHSVPWLLDDDTLSLGDGTAGRDFPLAALPQVGDVAWRELRAVPTALVTGSNGKTTTVRLIAACARAHGWHAGYSCTDGIFADGEALATGDYSGPAGARRVLRDRRVEAAVLETARGGILRRGLAVMRTDVAVVTNVSADHFGEYGIHDLDALADAKLTVGAAVVPGGWLVLNASDPLLHRKVAGLQQRYGRRPEIAWFSVDGAESVVPAHVAAGGAACGLRDGRLLLWRAGVEHDLGPTRDMPLTAGGQARYNVANLAAAALAAVGLGIEPATVAAVFARFGAQIGDNPGRLMRFERDGVQVLVDYAHNPEGLRGLLQVAAGLRGDGGRLGLVLGHAGNREDRDIERLAATAAGFRPSLVVLKELEDFRRGREPGEVSRILRTALLHAGMTDAALPQRATELEAVEAALHWAGPGDVVVLPVHGLAARAAVVELLQRGRP